jgi:rod shape-determining protein MreC
VARDRSARAAVLGSSVHRSAPQPYPSQKSSAVKRRLVVGVLVVVALALITVSFRASGVTPLQNAGASVLRPFQVAATRIAQPFQDAYSWSAGLVHAKSQNAKLRKEVDALRGQAFRNQEAAQENDVLRRELRYVESPRFPQDYDYVATSVISPPQSRFDQTMVIDAGSNYGLRQDDPVVTPDGLVGKVTRVGGSVAQVMLLTDEDSAVSASDLNHPGATGIVKHGEGGLGTLILDRVDKAQPVAKGDPVITEGSPGRGLLPSIYPRGIRIGVVTSVGQNDTDLYEQIQVQPYVDFSSLRSVLVLVPKSRTGR